MDEGGENIVIKPFRENLDDTKQTRKLDPKQLKVASKISSGEDSSDGNPPEETVKQKEKRETHRKSMNIIDRDIAKKRKEGNIIRKSSLAQPLKK